MKHSRSLVCKVSFLECEFHRRFHGVQFIRKNFVQIRMGNNGLISYIFINSNVRASNMQFYVPQEKERNLLQLNYHIPLVER